MDGSGESPALDSVGVVVAVCISSGGVPKHPINAAELTSNGLIGDDHEHPKHRRLDRAVLIQDLELLEQLAAEGFPVAPGTMGENVTVRGVNVQALAVGDQLRFEGGAVVELASIRKPCYVLDAVHSDLKRAVVGRCGFLCRVIEAGTLSAGQRVSVRRHGERGPE